MPIQHLFAVLVLYVKDWAVISHQIRVAPTNWHQLLAMAIWATKNQQLWSHPNSRIVHLERLNNIPLLRTRMSLKESPIECCAVNIYDVETDLLLFLDKYLKYLRILKTNSESCLEYEPLRRIDLVCIKVSSCCCWINDLQRGGIDGHQSQGLSFQSSESPFKFLNHILQYDHFGSYIWQQVQVPL